MKKRREEESGSLEFVSWKEEESGSPEFVSWKWLVSWRSFSLFYFMVLKPTNKRIRVLKKEPQTRLFREENCSCLLFLFLFILWPIEMETFLLDALYPPSLVDPNTNYVHYTMRITIIDTVWSLIQFGYQAILSIYLQKKAFDVVMKLWYIINLFVLFITKESYKIFLFILWITHISYEFHFAPETILGEVRIRSVRILIGLGLTWFTRYWFPEELISLLAKPFLILTLPLDSYFVRTQSTEASPTYLATSSIACSYFVFPLISHQIWCFLIPSCYGEQRTKYNRFLHLSGSRFSLFLFLTPPRVVPNVWHFPYLMGATSTNSLMIKLQPKIYDHIMLTVRISFIPSVCSQVPVIVIRLPEPRGLSVETSTNNRRFLMVFPLLTAALSTPPDIWCQIVAPFLIFSIIELAIFVASIVQVREEGWTSGMRESGSIDKKE